MQVKINRQQTLNYVKYHYFSCSSRHSGRVHGVRTALSDLKLVWDWNSFIDWLIFQCMERALHFATKLNSTDIQKCNCFWVPSYDLFTSARKAVSPAPTATGVYRLRNTWSSLWEVICHKKVKQYFLNQRLIPPPPPPSQKFLGPPLGNTITSRSLVDLTQLAVTRVTEELNSELPRTNPAGSQGGDWTRGLRITIPALLTADHFTFPWNCPPTPPLDQH